MAGQNIKMATDENFENEVLKSGKPSLVDFWAIWCRPCKALSPIIDELASQYSEQINVFKMNIDDNPNTPAKFGVRGIPTVILFKGGEVVEQSVGVVPKAELEKLILKVV